MKLEDATYEELMMQLALNGLADPEIVQLSACMSANGKFPSVKFLNAAHAHLPLKKVIKKVLKVAQTVGKCSVHAKLRDTTWRHKYGYEELEVLCWLKDKPHSIYPAVIAIVVLKRR